MDMLRHTIPAVPRAVATGGKPARIAPQPVELLRVEDHPGDARLVEEALRDGKFWHRLRVVSDGTAALAVLRREGAHTTATRPDLVLLDLHLPGKDGWAVLDAMAGDAALRRIPVVVLATDPEERALARWNPPVVGRMIKLPDLGQLLAVVASVARFGPLVVALPAADPALAAT